MVLKSLQPAYGGYTIARDEKVILIKGAIPGEVVEVAIEEKKKDYAIASVVNVIEPSEYRIEPRCSVFGVCGGCQLQFVSYEKQLMMKDEIILDSLKRLAGVEINLDAALSDLAWNYRHRAQFKVSRNGEAGLFRESSRDIVTFQSCPLMNHEINALLQKIKEGEVVQNLSEIHIAVGDSAIVFLKGREIDRALPEKYRAIGFAGVMLDDGTCAGEAYTHLDLNGMKYTVAPRTFFQAHWSLNRKVVDFVIQQLLPLAGKRILDFYAGAGNFSIPLAAHADEVVAVEENSFAVEDGLRNRELNSVKNCKFVKISAEKYKIKKKYDIFILDPPRPGLTSDMANRILENPADTVVYISCNPATLARDLKKLNDKYAIKSVRQIDFFPNTFHIETIAFLQIR
ncbi:MAG: class I SAM-dependent RNA methyltransferase [Nitrospirota bacterium]|nr:class I SAM-dependent RNA methyltransferase [Nitrospirota bacterium]